jgi:hypothetical protein
VLGAYCIVRAISPSAHAITALMRPTIPTIPADSVARLIEAVLYIALGLSLMLGSRGFSRFLHSLGHDPDKAPAQQVGLRFILIFIVGVAILLGAVRILVR